MGTGSASLVALREEPTCERENSGASGRWSCGDDGDRVDCAWLGKVAGSVAFHRRAGVSRNCVARPIFSCGKGGHPVEPKGCRKTSPGGANCVLLTGNGQPAAVSTAGRRLHEEPNCPSRAGGQRSRGYHIYSFVKQGSINLAFEKPTDGHSARNLSDCPARTRSGYGVTAQRGDQTERGGHHPRKKNC